MIEQPPESIRALAHRLDRDVHDVHDDLHLLAEYDSIHFETDGQRKVPCLEHEAVVVEPIA